MNTHLRYILKGAVVASIVAAFLLLVVVLFTIIQAHPRICIIFAVIAICWCIGWMVEN